MKTLYPKFKKSHIERQGRFQSLWIHYKTELQLLDAANCQINSTKVLKAKQVMRTATDINCCTIELRFKQSTFIFLRYLMSDCLKMTIILM